MIKKEDLRIGNLIHSKKHGKDFTVSGISEYCIYQSDIDYDERIRFEDIEPIPTTSKRLELFGFELIKSGNPSPSDWFWIKDNIALWNKTWIAHGAKKSLEYIHKLQNYYYENTDKELSELKIKHINKK